MATAYAAFTSLMHLMADLQEQPRPPIQLDGEQSDALRSMVSFFRRFLEDHHSTVDLGLEIRMADAAHAAEEVIEAHIANRALDLYESLGRVIQGMDLIKKQVMDINENEQSQCYDQPDADNLLARVKNLTAKTEKLRQMGSDWLGNEAAAAAYGETVDSLRSKIRSLQGYVDHENMISIHEGLQRVEQDVDHILEKASKSSVASSQPSSSSSTTTSGEDKNSTSAVIGIEDIAIKIIDKLTSQPKSARMIISISGMGGIGKTTLARKVYDTPYANNYYDVLAWATISKDYITHESLVELLHCLDRKKTREKLRNENEYGLGEQLYKFLIGRRYLVILDDVWHVEAWDRLRSFFPASSGSGIVITTREASVASIGSHDFVMDLLDERKSWDLFYRKVFGKQSASPGELEDVGRNIAKKCRGLPLSIVVIGGHLAKSPRTREYWEYVSQNLSSVVNSEDDEHCLKVLYLSYSNLPVHLKPCYLYMGIFLEDEEIRVSQLIRLWVAEGFVSPTKGKSLEEVGRGYLVDLIRRNLIFPCNTSLRGKLTSCKIHDLLRALCLKEASEKNFLFVAQESYYDITAVTEGKRRAVVHPGAYAVDHYHSTTLFLNPPPALRTLILHGTLPVVVYKSLRVLASVSGSFTITRNALLEIPPQLPNMRCLDFSQYIFVNKFLIPPSVCLLWNLQSLVVESYEGGKAPPEIWTMSQLRHIKVSELYLPDPPKESSDIILKNLQSARRLFNFDFSEEMARRIPDVKKLTVAYDYSTERGYTLSKAALFEKLESLHCTFASKRIQPSPAFPHSLKKLIFSNIRWEQVTSKIGSLPLLQVLVLYNCRGREWKLVEGHFAVLKHLDLRESDDLECITAEIGHFPRLQNLVLHEMYALNFVSSDIGDIATLRSIELYNCADTAILSAKGIADEQYEMENEELKVKARLDRESELSSDLSTSNFHVESYDW